MKKRKKINIRPWEENISAVLLLTMLILLTLVFISRKLAGFSFAFSEEIVVQLFMCITMFSISSCLVSGMLMGMSLITDRLSGKAKKISYVVIFGFSLFMFGFLGVQGWEMAMDQLKYGLRTPILQMPQFIFTLCMPIGCLMFIIRAIQMLINQLNGYHDMTDDELMATEAEAAMNSQEARAAVDQISGEVKKGGGQS